MAGSVDKKDNKIKGSDVENEDVAVGAASGRPAQKSKVSSTKSKAASSKAKVSSRKEKADSAKDDTTASVDGDVSCEVEVPSSEVSEVDGDDVVLERDKYLRLYAEYDNFRKRSAKEREVNYIAARADTVAKLLPVYDNLERALKMECADAAFYKGVEMTMSQLLEIFEDMDIRPIAAVGEFFDPNRHNAVMMVENPELGEKVVAEELQKGFVLGERVIRFSTVVVAN